MSTVWIGCHDEAIDEVLKIIYPRFMCEYFQWYQWPITCGKILAKKCLDILSIEDWNTNSKQEQPKMACKESQKIAIFKYFICPTREGHPQEPWQVQQVFKWDIFPHFDTIKSLLSSCHRYRYDLQKHSPSLVHKRLELSHHIPPSSPYLIPCPW